MIYKETKENLLKEGLIKKSPADHKPIMNLNFNGAQECF